MTGSGGGAGLTLRVEAENKLGSLLSLAGFIVYSYSCQERRQRPPSWTSIPISTSSRWSWPWDVCGEYLGPVGDSGRGREVGQGSVKSSVCVILSLPLSLFLMLYPPSLPSPPHLSLSLLSPPLPPLSSSCLSPCLYSPFPLSTHSFLSPSFSDAFVPGLLSVTSVLR